MLGLEGELPDEVDVTSIAARVATIRGHNRLCLGGEHTIDYHHDEDFTLHRRKALPFHPNGMVFKAFDKTYKLIEVDPPIIISLFLAFIISAKNSVALSILSPAIFDIGYSA